MPSVMQEWTHDLPLREQGTIVVALRGCDMAPKRPYDSPERQLVSYLRFLVMVPADQRELNTPGGFMQWYEPVQWRQSDLGHYPLHWVAHLMHGYEVVGYRHPQQDRRLSAFYIYRMLCRGLHLPIEGLTEMEDRLSEDRIKNGNVVS